MRTPLDPDEIFLDSRNLPEFDRQQFEGQIEKPISKTIFYWLGIFASLVVVVFFARAAELQVYKGAALATRSENNTLRHIPIFAERGLILDRYGEELVWNDPALGRRYHQEPGLAHVVGYINRINEEEATSGEYYLEELIGREGVERLYNPLLRGTHGVRIEEVDATGRPQSQYLLVEPAGGESLTLSIDAKLQTQLYKFIEELAAGRGLFNGGAGAIIDVYTGELLALVSAPEYDPNILTAGEDKLAIANYLRDPRHLFLNRAVVGQYPPGSIIKPFIALAALEERVIDPAKQILSTGALTLPNPFNPTNPSIFRDWKAHGWVDMRRALAVSSNVYFYEVGGGFEGQPGLGISRIAEYANQFGFGRSTGLDWSREEVGLVPTPAWKERVFDGDPWRLGDTYHTAIGQYGFQVTPVQVVRAVAALANGGQLVTPTITAQGEGTSAKLEPIAGLEPDNLQIIKEGMRAAVEEGTAIGLNTLAVEIAAKTGTAELGNAQNETNSWVMGFFPYEAPRYAFAVVMERSKPGNLIGATYVMRQLVDWMSANRPEYFNAS